MKYVLNRKTVERLICLVIIVVFSLTSSLVGCAKQSTTAAKDDLALKVKWFTYYSENDVVYKSIMTCLDEYKKKVPGFEIEVENLSDRDAYKQKIRILAAGNQMPDWLNIDNDAYSYELYTKGYLLNIEDFLKRIDRTDSFIPLALEMSKSTMGDKPNFCFSWQQNVEDFFYNKKMFEAAGVTPPSTFDEFMNVCAKLKQKGYIPLAVSGIAYWHILRFIAFVPFRLEGNQYVKDLAVGKRVMTGDPVGIKTAQWVYDLGKNGYFPADFANLDYNQTLQLFTGGKAAIYYMGTWEIASLLDDKLPDDMKGNIDFFPIPMLPGATTTLNDGYLNYGSSTNFNEKTMDNNKAFDELMKFVIDRFPTVNLQNNSFSAMKNVTIPDNLPPLLKKVQDQIKVQSQSKIAGSVWDVILDPVTQEVISNQVISLALAQTTPEKFCAAIDKSIAENGPTFFKDQWQGKK
jgi:raffinose/stachyose/melibiose transport system substrate-binding protein